MRRCIYLLFTMVVLGVAERLPAATFFGPTPYLSAADSPFDLSGLGSTFWLEDFEDGELNTPGVRQLGLPALHAIVRGPSELTDSVDADDGVIDGFGRAGNSLLAIDGFDELSEPPVIYRSVTLQFDAMELGFLPTAAGFAWTDGGEFSSVRIMLFDESFSIIESHWTSIPQEYLGDDRVDGTTAEDRFLGVFNSRGIYAIQFTSRSQGELQDYFELDHLQYGLAVPEPSTASQCGSCMLTMFIVICLRRWRTCR